MTFVLRVNPSFELEFDLVQRQVPRADPAGMQIRTRMAWDAPLRRVRLVWSETTDGEARALREAYLETAFGVHPMLYTFPREIAPRLVEFVAGEPIEVVQTGTNSYDMSATIQEVR